MPFFLPDRPDYQQQSVEVLPANLVSFIYGLCAASSAIWSNGGLLIREVAIGPAITWHASTPSERPELLEFFACVCGNRSLEDNHDAEPALCAFEEALKSAFPSATLHLQVEAHERSWWCDLHVQADCGDADTLVYFRLSWCVD